MLGEADGTVVDDVTSGPTDAGAVAEDVCAAGCSSWVDGCPENEVTRERGRAARPDDAAEDERQHQRLHPAPSRRLARSRRQGMGGGVAGG